MVVKNYTSFAAAVTFSLTSLSENLDGNSFYLQKLLIAGTKNAFMFG